jgi:hypothetical protein
MIRLYHVSEREFSPGAILTPGAERGEQHILGTGGRNDTVFLAGSLEEAWLWTGLLLGPESRVFHTYEVEPLGPVLECPISFAGDLKVEYRTKAARVVRLVGSEVINPDNHT